MRLRKTVITATTAFLALTGLAAMPANAAVLNGVFDVTVWNGVPNDVASSNLATTTTPIADRQQHISLTRVILAGSILNRKIRRLPVISP